MRLHFTFAALAAFVSLTPVAAPAWAGPLENPTAEYTAEKIGTTDGHNTYYSKIWYTIDRVFVIGPKVWILLDRKTRTAIVMMPYPNMQYAQIPADDEALSNPTDNFLMGGSWNLARVGTERIGGVETEKWRVSGKFPKGGAAFTGFVWITKEDIQVRMEGVAEKEGRTVKVLFELRNLKIGPVDRRVFEIPKGFKPFVPSAPARPKN